MSASIYDRHATAFHQVRAYVIMKIDHTHAERVATIAFKFLPKGHGERRLWAYVHWLGSEMVRGYASGYSYDKRTAACSSAASKALGSYPCAEAPHTHDVRAFWHALEKDEGLDWSRQLELAGFTVLQAD